MEEGKKLLKFYDKSENETRQNENKMHDDYQTDYALDLV